MNKSNENENNSNETNTQNENEKDNVFSKSVEISERIDSEKEQENLDNQILHFLISLLMKVKKYIF